MFGQKAVEGTVLKNWLLDLYWKQSTMTNQIFKQYNHFLIQNTGETGNTFHGANIRQKW